MQKQDKIEKEFNKILDELHDDECTGQVYFDCLKEYRRMREIMSYVEARKYYIEL